MQEAQPIVAQAGTVEFAAEPASTSRATAKSTAAAETTATRAARRLGTKGSAFTATEPDQEIVDSLKVGTPRLRCAAGLHDQLGGRGMPITAFYDGSGRLIDFVGGALPENALLQKLRQLYDVQI